MHPLLKKQIEKYFGSEANIPVELQGFLSGLTEVFEQDINESNLRVMAEEQLRKIFNGTSDAILIFNPTNDRILETNPRAIEILAYSQSELLAMPASALHPNQADVLDAFNQDVLKNGYGWTNQLTCMTKNGHEIQTEISASLIRYSEGEKAILAIIKDTSVHHEAEEELKIQREFLRQVIDTNPSFVFAKDREGKYTLANKAMAEEMGIPVDQIIGRRDRSFNPDIRRVETYEHQDLQVFETGKPVIEPQELTVSPEGVEQYRQVIKLPLFDKDGEVSQVIGVVNDITPLKLAEQSLRQQNQTLEVISDIAREITLTASLDTILDKASQAITDTLEVSSNYIHSWNSESSIATVISESISKNAQGYEQDVSIGLTYNLGETFAEIDVWLRTSKEPKIIQVKDVQNPALREYYSANETKTALYIPILLEEQTFGYIEIYESRDSREFTQTELDFLEALASQLGIAFNNNQLFSALQMSEQRFRSLIENISEIITIVDETAVIQYISPNVKALLGYEQEELEGTNIFDKIHRRDMRRVYDVAMESVGDPKIVREFNFKFRHKNGQWASLESTVNIVPTEEDSYQIFITSRDVSAQIENRERQIEQFERRGRQAEFTNRLTRRISLTKSRIDLYTEITSSLHTELDIHYHHVQFFRYNPAVNQLILVTAAGPKAKDLVNQGHQLNLHQGVSGQAAGQTSSVLVQDTLNKSGWQPTPMVENTRSELATPVMLGDELLGVINVQSTEPEDFDTDIQVLLEVLSGQIAVALESIRLNSEMEERIEELNVLQRAASVEGWQTFHKSSPLTSSGYVFDPLDESPSALTNGASNQETNLIKPMLVQGQEIGSIGIHTDPSQPLTPEEQSLLDEITTEVSEALERARLFEASQRSAAELAILNEMGNAFTEALNERAIIDNIFTYVAKLMEVDDFFVALFDEENQMISFPLVYIENQIMQPDHPRASDWYPREAGSGLTGYIISNRQPVLIEANAEEVLTNLSLPFIQAGEMTQSWVGVPMTVGERVLGVINVQSDETAGLYNDHHLDLLTSIASQASIAIDNARLFEQEQSRAQQERLVRTITDRVRRGTDRNMILQIALEEIGNAMGAKKSMIKLGTPDQLKNTPPPTAAETQSDVESTEEA